MDCARGAVCDRAASEGKVSRMKKIRVLGVTKRYGSKTVLDNVSFEIERNAVFCLMGPSGCGKTTLVRIMTGLEKADKGRIKGINADRIAFVFQEDRLIDHLSALSNAILPLGKNEKSIKAGMKALALLGLKGEEKKPAQKLSGGMARRVAIARAMLADADIVFMDEPFKGLDRENREKAIGFVKKYAEGKTLIVVTHSPTEAQLLNGTVYQMPIPAKKTEEKSEN